MIMNNERIKTHFTYIKNFEYLKFYKQKTKEYFFPLIKLIRKLNDR